MIEIFNSKERRSVGTSEEALTKTLHLGMLHWYLERAKLLVKKEREILRRTYENMKNNGSKNVARTFNGTNKSVLVFYSKKYIYKVSKALDALALEILDYSGIFPRKDFIIEDLNEMLDDIRKGKVAPNKLVVKGPLFVSSYVIRDTEKVTKKKSKVFVRELEQISKLPEHPVYSISYNVDRDEDVYYGTIFRMSDKNINILREFKRTLSHFR